MESILNWGVETIVWLQQFSPQLDLPFKALTFLGNEEFFMLILPFVYWSLDRRTGARLAILFLFSAYVNTVAKALAGQPRPFQYDKAVKPLIRSGGGGFPSGHTQSAVVIWGYLAAAFQRPWLWIVPSLTGTGPSLLVDRLYALPHLQHRGFEPIVPQFPVRIFPISPFWTTPFTK